MKNIYIYCEGQTEETFINNLLQPYLLNFKVYVNPVICRSGKRRDIIYKGGTRNYQKIKKELSNLCKEHKNETVTTMFDYYGLPTDTPGLESECNNLFDKVAHIEESIKTDLCMDNLLVNLTVHEFEGLLFSDVSAFESVTEVKQIELLKAVRAEFETPEHINNSNNTAPSKRLFSIISGYSKIRHGMTVSEKIGIEVMIRECGHFSNWINKLKEIGK
jgi:hypothetical protein